MIFHEWTYIHLMLIIPLLFLLFILSKNLKTFARKFYFMTVSSFVFWLLFNFLYVNAVNEKMAIVFYSMLLVFVSLAAGTLFLTAVNFHKKAGVWCYLTSLVPLVVLIFIVPREVNYTDFGWQILYSFNFILWESVVFLVVLLGVYLLIKLRMDVRNKILKKKLFYLILSAFLSVVSGIVATFFSIYLNVPSFSSIFASLSVMIAYFAFKK